MLKFLKSKTAKTVGGLMVVGMFLFASSASAALTTSQVNAIIGLLNSFGANATTVANVRASLTGTAPVVSSPSATVDFGSAVLKVGSKGQYVKNLQSFVGTTADGDFGPMTKAKVMAWQSNNGLVADGIFGPASKAKANSSSSVVTPVVVPPVVSTGPVVASIATNNPASGSVLSGQALADLAHFTFTGSGTVNQITLQRTGLSVSADVDNVYLFEGNKRLTDSASINTAGVIVFNNLNLAVNGSRTISVRADMASSTSSVNLGVNLVSYMTASSTTPVTANLVGNLFTVYAAPAGVAKATLSNQTVTGDFNGKTPSVNAGTMGYTVWSTSLAVSGRTALLKSLNLHYVGSAPVDAIANAKLYLDGSQIGSTATVSANGYLFFDLGAGVNLSVSSHTLSVRADIIKGSNRNFQLSLQNSSDLMIADSQIGININAKDTTGSGTAATIFVNSGTVTIATDPTFDTSLNITGGATNVTIARYKLTAYGEDMKISSLDVAIAGQSSMNNVALFANGGQIGSSQNYSGTKLVYNLGSSLIIPAGTTTIIAVKADTINSSNVNIISGTVQVTLSGASNNAQGMSSQNLIQVPGSGLLGGSLNVSSASATVSLSPSLNSATNIIENNPGTKIGSFIIQAGSTEGVRVTNLQVGLTGGMNLSSVSNLYTSDNTTSIVPNPTTANNFPVNYTVTPNSSRTVDVYADIGSLGTVANTTAGSAVIATSTNASTISATPAVGSVTVIASTTSGAQEAITVNGYPSAYTTVSATDTADTIAAGLVAAINTNTNVNGTVVASTSTTAGEVVITAKTAGTNGNSAITLGYTSSDSLSFTVVQPTGGTDVVNAAQVNTITPANVVVGNVFSVTINGTTVSYTATDVTVANVTAGLTTAINGNSTVNTIVTAVDTGSVVTVTADTAGTGFTIATSVANGSHSAVGTKLQSTLKVTAVGSSTNVALPISGGIGSSLPGQIMTIQAGTLSTPTLVSTSPITQLVVGGRTQPVASYNFISTIGTSTINEMKFTTTNNTVTSISVGGVSKTVVGNSVDISGLSIPVSASYAGSDIPISVTYNKVGLNGLDTDNQVSTVTLTYVKYASGNNTTTTEMNSLIKAANDMYLVASKPSITLADSADQLVSGQVKLASVTVSADSAGPIKLLALPITSTLTGFSAGLAVNTSTNLIAKVSGSSVSGVTGKFSSTSGGAAILTFGTPYTIPAGQFVTFDIYGEATGVTGAVGTMSISTTLGSASSFSWNDVNSASGGTVLDGANIANYPTNTSVISN